MAAPPAQGSQGAGAPPTRGRHGEGLPPAQGSEAAAMACTWLRRREGLGAARREDAGVRCGAGAGRAAVSRLKMGTKSTMAGVSFIYTMVAWKLARNGGFGGAGGRFCAGGGFRACDGEECARFYSVAEPRAIGIHA